MDVNIWNAVLSLLVGLLGWVLREKSAELQRVTILVSKTREEIAKEYVTKAEVHADINRVLDRLDRLDVKLDRMLEKKRAFDE